MKIMVSGLLILMSWCFDAGAQVPFFQGKIIRFVVGYPAGSTHDSWARTVGPFLTKYIPGNPTTIVQNMPEPARRWRPTMFTLRPNRMVSVSRWSMRGSTSINFWGARKCSLTGPSSHGWAAPRARSRCSTCGLRRRIRPYRMSGTRRTPPKCGSTGTGNTGYYVPKLLEDAIGAKFTIVTGYPGGADIELAVERGEIQCRAISIPVYFGREPYHTWRQKGLARILIQTGKKRDPRVADAPTLYELMDQYHTPDATRRLASVLLGTPVFGLWPMMTSPGTSRKQFKTLRAAFVKALGIANFWLKPKRKPSKSNSSPEKNSKAWRRKWSCNPPRSSLR